MQILAGFAAGGGVDLTAHLMGPWLGERLEANAAFADAAMKARFAAISDKPSRERLPNSEV